LRSLVDIAAQALKLKQNLELVRLDMEQTARSLEIQHELTVMQSLNSCMLTYVREIRC